MTMIVDFCIYSAVSIPVHLNQCKDYDAFYEQEYMSGVFIGYRPGGVYMFLNVIYWLSKYIFSFYLNAPMLLVYVKCTCCSSKKKNTLKQLE